MSLSKEEKDLIRKKIANLSKEEKEALLRMVQQERKRRKGNKTK